MSDDPSPEFEAELRKAQEEWDADPDPTRVWTTDTRGKRVRRGLTETETEELERLIAAERAGQASDRTRYLELARKHDVARQQAIGAEVQARQERKH